MLMTAKKTKGSSDNRTLFKDELNKVMVEHDVFTWTSLLKRFEEVGYPVGQSRLSMYVNGDRTIEDVHGFFTALSVALNLTKQEEARVARGYAYSKPRRRAPEETPENTKAIDDVHARWDEEDKKREEAGE